MKSESANAPLEAAVRMIAAKVSDLEAAMLEFEGSAAILDRLIKAEEDRTRIKDANDPAYSNLAKSVVQRRNNLRASAASLKVKLEEARREHNDALMPLDTAVSEATRGHIARRPSSRRT
jgi:hypothetical protein